ncbi:N-acetylmuramoyl-L-alanine amidase [Litchfieldia alkalitelluris]|uniref:N-acetylmuramoyl-L-alanine amidase n=1 Tax=Litchfieldia alkalitelluris TaxID=304268 RepID=UPI000996B98B|nr:N-acetylmuramoyl-L-alanine amidase [Litchfieldia alkalitelluris]
MKIVLDAGHGYHTPGKRTPDGMREFEFNSRVTEGARELLMEYENVDVFFTHSSKRDVPLKERVNLANRLNANLFISIHANAFGDEGWTQANGIETYIHTSRPKEAAELAKIVQANLITKTNLKDRGVKVADFFILKETKMTALLCECGFMTNIKEAKLLHSIGYQRTCADAIVQGVVSYFNLKKKLKEIVTLYTVQVGAFQTKESADAFKKALIAKGYPAFITEKEDER